MLDMFFTHPTAMLHEIFLNYFPAPLIDTRRRKFRVRLAHQRRRVLASKRRGAA